MSFPAYPKYKCSGVEWLGEVPEHWAVQPLKRRFTLMDRPVREEDGIVTAFRDGEVTLRSSRREDGFTNALQEIGYQGVRTGDLVIHAMDAFAGAIGVSDSDGKSTPVYSVCEPSGPETFAIYYAYLLRDMALSGFVSSLAKGIRERSTDFRWADAGKVLVPVPPTSEQSQIISFICEQTERIDALVEEQRRLIELLKEKRQAIVSHAVTKGLNPSAPMKRSGTEWIGSIPEHWDAIKIKWVAKVESGHTPDKKIEAYWENGDIPWVSLNDTGFLRDHDWISETAYFTTAAGIEHSSARLLPANSVVFSRDATIGRCAITTREMAVSQHFIAWLCGARVVPEYLLRVCRSMEQELERLTFGATIKTIGMEDVRALATPLPPVSEQQEIVEYLRQTSSRIDQLIDAAEKSLSLLNERRSALISAAVTGKIDVRQAVLEPVA